MKSIRVFSLAFVAAGMALAAVAADALLFVGAAVAQSAERVWDLACGAVLAISSAFKRETDWTDVARPDVPLIQSREYAMRQAKRDRPVMSPTWRMCPST